MSDKPRFPARTALHVFLEILAVLSEPGWQIVEGVVTQQTKARCRRIAYAGSLRRRRPDVGDLEVLYVPSLSTKPQALDLLGQPIGEPLVEDHTAAAIDGLIDAGLFTRRLKSDGTQTWGAKNRLAVHVATGLPVDFFATTGEAWANYMVCRTGPAESNTAIASAAMVKGCHWCPYDPGFRRGGTSWADAQERFTMPTERDVFAFVGMPYREAWERK